MLVWIKAKQMVGVFFCHCLEESWWIGEDHIFYEYYWEYEFPQTPTMHGIRTDRYKYIRYHGVLGLRIEFYDLQNDPYGNN